MGITNIQNQQKVSSSTTNTQGANRGLAVPNGGTPHTTPKPFTELVTLDLRGLLMKYNRLTKPSPRTQPKPAQRKVSQSKPAKKAPWYIRLFESIRWTPGPKY